MTCEKNYLLNSIVSEKTPRDSKANNHSFSKTCINMSGGSLLSHPKCTKYIIVSCVESGGYVGE